MKIIGIDGMTVQGLNDELQRGAKFVLFQYCISVIWLTFRRSSNIYFIRSGENPLLKSLPFTLLSLIVGWWGIPWGPIYTVSSVVTNFKGGKDVTYRVLAAMNQPPQ